MLLSLDRFKALLKTGATYDAPPASANLWLQASAARWQDLPPTQVVEINLIGNQIFLDYQLKKDSTASKDDVWGSLTLADLGKGKAYEIVQVQTQSQWGPLLYDIAMEIASSQGEGLVSDRHVGTSWEAHAVWNYYYKKRGPDVRSRLLDMNEYPYKWVTHLLIAKPHLASDWPDLLNWKPLNENLKPKLAQLAQLAPRIYREVTAFFANFPLSRIYFKGPKVLDRLAAKNQIRIR